MSDVAALNALERAQSFSPFLTKLIQNYADIIPMLSEGNYDDAWQYAHAIECDSIGEKLRRSRGAVALIAAIADLSGEWDLTTVTQRLSDFADHAVDQAIMAAFAEYLPGKDVIGFSVIALGKHGGRELNYSSDIDPIFIFDPETLPVDDGKDPSKIAVRIGKRIISLLSERTEHGYVLRVDMRLRPASEITPVTISVNAAISHYESSALAWEQAAFIRSRAAAGDIVLGEYFLKSIESFIWRRSLDFGQIDNIRKMSHNIRDHYSKGQILGAGYDLKRGRGGIRECEFFAQVHQLIHGGRNPSLRLSDTRQALTLLAAEGHIDDEDSENIAQSYILLRTIEHRLQMIDDRQTHDLPKKLELNENIAKLHGLDSADELMSLLQKSVDKVRSIYDDLVDDNMMASDSGVASLAEDSFPLLDQLETMGFANPKEIEKHITIWRSGKYRAIRSEAAHTSFETVIPDILNMLAKAPDPMRALVRFDKIIEQLPSAINFFDLLHVRPAILKLLGDILSYAPALADDLGRNASLIDGLIDNSDRAGDESLDDMFHQMQKYALASDTDYQCILDDVRNFVAEKRFALGAKLIEGNADPLIAARGYADIAQAATQILTQATIEEFEQVHGKVEGGELVIVALGRFGGGSLTHASDLDIIFLFTGEFSSESNGRRPLGATQYFNRLAQRIIAAMSVPTASGALYEVDTRLRPSGKQGLLCVSLDSFEQYQRDNAWTWEHMALTRARVVFGPQSAHDRVATIMDDIIQRQQDEQLVLNDIMKMRLDMDQHKASKGPLDIKNMQGGLIDIEFMVHALQLTKRAEVSPAIEKSISLLHGNGWLNNDILAAHQLMSKMLTLLRLMCPDLDDVNDTAKKFISDNLGFESWQELITILSQLQLSVKSQWYEVFGKNR